MRTVAFALEGREYHLLLNGAALFNIYDYFGQEVQLMDLLKEPGREGFGNTCWLLGELGQQGELYRRYQGYDPQPMPDAGALEVTLRPLDAIRAKRALMEAIAAGFLREEGENPKEIDKGLLELEKKRAPADPGPVSQPAVSIFGPVCSGGPAASRRGGSGPGGT